MRIRWKGERWHVRYYPEGYARWTLERMGTSVSWLQTEEQYFYSPKEFIRFLREKKEENRNDEQRRLGNTLPS